MKFGLIVFDIDGTLTESKLPINKDISTLLCRLLDKYKVAIISGAKFEQFKWQILDKLSCSSEKLKNLYLLPADGTIFCHEEGWQCESDQPMSKKEKGHIRKVFERVYEASGVEKPEKTYGEVIEDRGAQMNFSALGQKAPVELKKVWDPDYKKREKIVSALKKDLPGFSMTIGGTTSIEITREGVNKAHGLKKLMNKTGFTKDQILYVGDKLFRGGNDEPVLSLGIESKSVSSLEDTKLIMLELINQI